MTTLDTLHDKGLHRVAAALGETMVPDSDAPVNYTREQAAPPVTPDLDGLRMVVEAVRNAPEEQFDMSTFDCGTSACAIGWFCRENPTDNLFVQMGGIFRGLPFLRDGSGSCTRSICARFRISEERATEFFYPEGRPSRAEVIARIEQFISDHESCAQARRREDATARASAAAAVRRGHRAATGNEPDGTIFTCHINAAFDQHPKYVMARRSDGVPALYRHQQIGCGIDSEWLLDRLDMWTVDPADAWVDVAYVRQQYAESATEYRKRHGISEGYAPWRAAVGV